MKEAQMMVLEQYTGRPRASAVSGNKQVPMCLLNGQCRTF